MYSTHSGGIVEKQRIVFTPMALSMGISVSIIRWMYSSLCENRSYVYVSPIGVYAHTMPFTSIWRFPSMRRHPPSSFCTVMYCANADAPKQSANTAAASFLISFILCLRFQPEARQLFRVPMSLHRDMYYLSGCSSA